MARDIFSDVVRPSVQLGPRAWYTLPLSITAHAAIAAVVIVIPLMATDVVPAPASLGVFVTSPPPPVPPPPPPAAASTPRQPAQLPVDANVVLTEPSEKLIEEAPTPTVPGVPGGIGVPTGVLDSTGPIPTVPAIPLPAAPVQPVRAGSLITKPAKIKDVRPVYPAIAQSSRVQGRVIIEATIGIDGRVKDARILKSIPLLDRAALDAVMQWQFTPTLLNGVPVPVLMTVTVDFTLQ